MMFLFISDGILGLRYQNKSDDEKSPDPQTSINKIYVNHLVDPELELIPKICQESQATSKHVFGPSWQFFCLMSKEKSTDLMTSHRFQCGHNT